MRYDPRTDGVYFTVWVPLMQVLLALNTETRVVRPK